MPRKKSEDFYRLHDFTPNYERGKYTATCNICDKVLQNTALTRLSLHRQTCDERRRKLQQTERLEKDSEDQHQFKIQKISGEDDDASCSDTEGKEIIVKIQQILDAVDDGNDKKTRPPVLVKSETREGTDPDLEAEQHMEFEITGAEYVDDNKEQELGNSLNGSTMFLETRPRHNLAALKAEKMRAEIRHYQSKTKFLKTETENLKLERTLALLKIQKLRLEIDALRA